jgi:RND family efflux transporter MFP subunit
MAIQNGHDTPTSTRTLPEKSTSERSTVKTVDKKSGSGVWLWLILFLIVLGAVVVYVLWHKHEGQAALNENTEKMAQPTVLMVHPEKGDSQLHLTLPGTVDAQMESSVYAQVSGYVKRWLVDIGAQVKEGQLLAEIDTPVTDQQLKQAAESVKQAQANLDLAKATADRYNKLYETHAVSTQDIDNQNAGVKVQEANLSAAQAFEEGIQKTEGFKEVKAPFDGVITARHIDVGDYVSASGQTGSVTTSTGAAQNGAPNQEMFRVAQIKVLRVYVNVPETYSDQIVPGITATLTLASSPNKPVTGKLARTSNAIDPNSLTLLSEVDVDNADGKLLPGGYAQVHFDINSKTSSLIIPGNTLIFRQQGPQVGVVDEQGIVHLKAIKIGRDLGTKLEVAEGIKPEDAIIVNPSDSLADGQKVSVSSNNPDKKPQP